MRNPRNPTDSGPLTSWQPWPDSQALRPTRVIEICRAVEGSSECLQAHIGPDQKSERSNKMVKAVIVRTDIHVALE
jgi:hypothetical protein